MCLTILDRELTVNKLKKVPEVLATKKVPKNSQRVPEEIIIIFLNSLLEFF